MPSGRKSHRLSQFDYAQPGAYFVTICAFHLRLIFGQVVERKFVPNPIGLIVQQELAKSEAIRAELRLDSWVLMPNHLHAIIWLRKDDLPDIANVGATGRSPLHEMDVPRGPTSKSLGSFVAGFKSSCSKKINRFRHTPGHPVWQRNYYDHVIRDEIDLARHRQYILDNPPQWELDRYFVLG